MLLPTAFADGSDHDLSHFSLADVSTALRTRGFQCLKQHLGWFGATGSHLHAVHLIQFHVLLCQQLRWTCSLWLEGLVVQV